MFNAVRNFVTGYLTIAILVFMVVFLLGFSNDVEFYYNLQQSSTYGMLWPWMAAIALRN